MESAAQSKGRTARISLGKRGPYSDDWVLGFLGRRAIPEIEQVFGTVYSRVVGDSGLRVAMRLSAARLSISFPHDLGGTAVQLRRNVCELFDLDADSVAIDDHLARDPVLRTLVRRNPGLRVPGTLDGFELAVRAILGQQVSVARATVLARLLVQRYGSDGHGGFCFPSAACLARQTPAEIGMPGRRGEAIRALAERVSHGDLEISSAIAPAVLRGALREIPGIGPWTAEYITMRAGRDADAFPDSDWVIDKQLGTSPAGARRAAEAWRPYRAYAVMYLWANAAAQRTR